LIQTDPGDTRFCNYILEHGYQWVSGNPLHQTLWDCPIFFPVANTASYSELLLGSAPIYWFWRFLGFLPDTSFQFWMIVVGTLNYLCSLLLLRRGLQLSLVSSVGGAYLFSFASMRATQLSYQQLLPQFFSMIALFCLSRMFKAPETDQGSGHGRTWIWAMLFVISFAAQVLGGIYLGFFLFLGLAIALGFSLVFEEPRRAIYRVLLVNWLPLLVSTALVAPVIGWLAYHYGSAKTLLGARSWDEVALMIPRAKSWIDMGPLSYAYEWLGAFIDFSTLPNESVHQIGIGLLTTAIAIAGLYELFKVTWGKVIASCTILVIMAAFMYPGDWSPWIVLFKYVPGGDIIRVVSRISFLVLIGITVSVAFFLHRVRSTKLAVLLLILICAEQGQTTIAYNKYTARAGIQRIAKEIPKNCRSFYCVFQTGSSSRSGYWVFAPMDGMWAQLATNIPTVNGFSGNMPLGWAPLSVQVFVDSPWDLMRARINAFQWADLNGLPREDICVVPILHSSLSNNELGLGDFEIAPGTKESETCFGPGWGEDERDGDQVWTWAIDRHAKLFVPLLSGVPYKMLFTAVAMPNKVEEQKISIRLNGVPITTMPLSAEIRTYEVTLPKDTVSDLNKLDLFFQYAVSPAGIGKGDDTREVAMALFKIKFVAITDAEDRQQANQ
jgi:hypothetical protein